MFTFSASNLTKHYNDKMVVRNVSISLKHGEVVGLFGPNGAGKSTCFYMLLGLVMPDGGQVTIDNKDVTYAPLDARAEYGIGYLPQESSIFRKLSVEQNILSVIQLRSNISRKHRAIVLESLIEEFGLGHIRKSMGMSLSGGERRRVEVARALAMDPKFILLDEPFAGVDPVSIHELQRMIMGLKAKGIGVLITDHNIRDVLPICDRSYVLHDGIIIAEGPVGNILSNDKVKSVYLGSNFRYA